MSTDYGADLAIGYFINIGSLPKQFVRKKERVAHWEDRYDAKTGRKLPERFEVVTEDERTVYVLDGAEYENENFHEFMDQLAEKLGGCYGYSGDQRNDDSVVGWISPKVPKSAYFKSSPHGVDWAIGIKLDWLIAQAEPIRALGERLRAAGFKVAKPGVFAVLNIC